MIEEARHALDVIKGLRARARLETLDEAQLKQHWLRPVVDALGQHYAVQVKVLLSAWRMVKPKVGSCVEKAAC